MNRDIVEDLVIAILCVAAVAATAWTMWFMWELMWALRCAFRV